MNPHTSYGALIWIRMIQNFQTINSNQCSVGILSDLANVFETVEHVILLKNLENFYTGRAYFDFDLT